MVQKQLSEDALWGTDTLLLTAGFTGAEPRGSVLETTWSRTATPRHLKSMTVSFWVLITHQRSRFIPFVRSQRSLGMI